MPKVRPDDNSTRRFLGNRQKGNSIMKTEKREMTDRCPCCKQWWKREVEVPVAQDGIEFILIHDSKKNKYDLTINYIDVPKVYGLNGHTDVYPELSLKESYLVIEMYAIKYMKDDTVLRVESNFMDTYEIKDRRVVLTAHNVTSALKTLKKRTRQDKRNRRVEK